MELLKEKISVVTGAGRGIGRAVAIGMANEGATVVLSARSADEIEDAAEEIRSKGGRALAVQADVAQQESVDALFERVGKELGDAEILVNNAAIISKEIGLLWELDPNDWLDMFNVNVIGMVRCARAVLPSMIEKRYGKIIIVGSIAGYKEGWALRSHSQMGYALTKAAANHFSKVLSAQVRNYGINVNCIGVGAHTRLGFAARQELARKRGQPPPPSPEARPDEERIEPEENVPPFIFLASHLADHITGEYIEANMMTDGQRRGIKSP